MENLGIKIKMARKASRLSQGELGGACGWEKPQTRISNYETNAREPSLGDLERMASVMGLTLVQLLTYGESPQTNHTQHLRPDQAEILDFYEGLDIEERALWLNRGRKIVQSRDGDHS